ncbi:hypothetical protein RRG08_021341 [Elysia crispata]|uniref:Uncharacterized protein n=1 Tax=Elysia crispata TaxID=231223 RepID=A0AAE1B0M9_9GAST|nr:hypothetical protein RRG08_021341 [Elysia crispata]
MEFIASGVESDRVEEDKSRIPCWALPAVTGTCATYTIFLSSTHPCFSSIFLFDMFGSEMQSNNTNIIHQMMQNNNTDIMNQMVQSNNTDTMNQIVRSNDTDYKPNGAEEKTPTL